MAARSRHRDRAGSPVSSLQRRDSCVAMHQFSTPSTMARGNRTVAASISGMTSHAMPRTADGADYSLEGNAVAGVRAQTWRVPENSNAMAKPIAPSLNVRIPTIPPIGCGTRTNRPGHHYVRG